MLGSSFSEEFILCAEYDSRLVNPSTTRPEYFSGPAIVIIGVGSEGADGVAKSFLGTGALAAPGAGVIIVTEPFFSMFDASKYV